MPFTAIVCTTMISATLHGAPNLTPYQPGGWSDKIVVATGLGTTMDSSPLTTADTLYLDWAVVNNGDTGTGMGFYTSLYVDGVFKNFWYVSTLNPNYYSSVNDYSLGQLSAGIHTLTITNDSYGGIAESNESDNAYTKLITVNPPSVPNLVPHAPAAWSEAIVVSSTTGTTTNSPTLTPADPVYVDWAVLNNGSAATGARFYTALYVDGSLRATWYTDPPLATNSHATVLDYSLGTFSLGSHMLMIMTDTTAAIAESNETDNTYSRYFTVSPPPAANLALHQPAGWSDKVVVATNSSSTTDSALTTADSLFASWALTNSGGLSVTNSFTTTLSVDGVLRNTWTNSPPLAPGSSISAIGFAIGTLNVGLHTVTVETDPGGAVAESNESDNSYIKLVAVLQAPPTVQTLAATNLTDDSAQLQAALNAHLGHGYAWFDYGPDLSYGNATPLQHFEATATNVTFTLSGLSAKTLYHYRVMAYNGGGTNYGQDVAFTTLGPEIRIEPLTLTFPPSEARVAFSPPLKSSSTTPVAATDETTVRSPEQKLRDAPEINRSLTRSNVAKVIVLLEPPSRFGLRADFATPAARQALQAKVKSAQRDVLAAMPPADVQPRLRFDHLAGFSAEVSAEGLKALQSHPRVVSIEPVYVLTPCLAQGIPLMHGVTYRSRYNGAGLAVAICDTGVDYTHPRLGGGGFPNSKVLGGYDFGDDDADPIPNGAAHGTCCSGIVAGALGTVEDYIGGVAYNAKLYALKISPGTTGSSSTEAMVAAWDWCVTHQNDDPHYPIMVISTSFGGGRNFSPCDADVPAMTAAANNAVAAGITVLAASGNEGYCDAIAWPACISSVISVGAVYDASFGHAYPCLNSNSCAPKIAGGCASGYHGDDVTAPDKVTSYANMASFVTLLAPANACYTTDIVGAAGESTGDYDPTFGGTSAACPYTAGAVACLQSAAKARTGSYLTPPEVRDLLVATGDNVTDTKVAITKPRVNLARAIESLPDYSQTFRLYNDGAGLLSVGAITSASPTPWIQVSPAEPFEVSGASYQEVNVLADLGQAPARTTTIRLLVTSNDAEQSPYPGGVFVTTIVQSRPVLSAMSLSNGVFQFLVTSTAGSNCVVETSTNLVHWWGIATNTIPSGGVWSVTDPSMSNQSPRFYRAFVPQ